MPNWPTSTNSPTAADWPSGEQWPATAEVSESGIFQDGKSDYQTAPDGTSFNLSVYTVDFWWQLYNFGTIGGGGGSTGYPIVSKGTGFNETVFWTGIDSSLRLRSGFEDGAGVDQPATGVRVHERGVWYHGAASYDGTNWRLWSMGALDKTQARTGPPCTSSAIMAIATGRRSTGAATGRFHGNIRNVRIWDRALDQSEIQTSAVTRTSMAGTANLVGEWLLNDGEGETAAGYPFDLACVGNANWVESDCPFQLDTPGTVTITGPADLSSHSGSVSVAYSISDVDSNAQDIEVWYRIQESELPFTVLAQPDPQYLSEAWNAALLAQSTDMVDNWVSRRTVIMVNEGDCVNTANATQFDAFVANCADVLGTTHPHVFTVGNHDQSPNGDPTGTTLWNQYFGEDYWADKPWYSGRYEGHDVAFGGPNYDNYWVTVTIGSLTLSVITLEYEAETVPDPDVIEWAAGVIEANPTHLFIIVSHYLTDDEWPGAFTTQGQLIYDAIQSFPNVLCMLNGHLTEGQRVDSNEIPGFGVKHLYTLMSDYQNQQGGANRDKYRIMEFRQRDGICNVRTYSPGQATYEQDSDSEFSFPVDFLDEPWQLHGVISGVAAGGTGNYVVTGVPPGSHVEVFFKSRNGNVTRESERRGFNIT